MSERQRRGVDAAVGIPSDPRSTSWPTVLQRRRQNRFEKRDEVALADQLGYLPGNVIHISARIKDLPSSLHVIDTDMEAPVVALLYPIAVREETQVGRKRKRHPADKEGFLAEPFPTIYWITHPEVRSLISNLETKGRGFEYEQRLATDPKVRQSMETAHTEYATERWKNILTEEDREWLTQRKWHPHVGCQHGRGIAGSRYPATVKCLHAHAAHYWSGNTNNTFGEWVVQELCNVVAETVQKNQADVICHEPVYAKVPLTLP